MLQLLPTFLLIAKSEYCYGNWRENLFFLPFAWNDTKYLGTIVSFPERSADVCLAHVRKQFTQTKSRPYKCTVQVLDVSTHALDVPDIDNYVGLIHILFTLEDVYGLTVSKADDEIRLKVDTSKGKEAHKLLKMLYTWKEQADKLFYDEISKDEYDNWRYHYPEFDTTQIRAKIPFQEHSDALVKMLKSNK